MLDLPLIKDQGPIFYLIDYCIAALMIGLGRSAAVYFAPEFDVLIPYLIMVAVLLIKPEGLFTTLQTRKV